jgi:hypothetical protein
MMIYLIVADKYLLRDFIFGQEEYDRGEFEAEFKTLREVKEYLWSRYSDDISSLSDRRLALIKFCVKR